MNMSEEDEYFFTISCVFDVKVSGESIDETIEKLKEDLVNGEHHEEFMRNTNIYRSDGIYIDNLEGENEDGS